MWYRRVVLVARRVVRGGQNLEVARFDPAFFVASLFVVHVASRRREETVDDIFVVVE